MLNSTNHVNALLLFFLSTLVYYSYCYSINCNWIRLIILLWYARRISVLFYLLACYNSSLSYSNIYSNKQKYLWFQHFDLFRKLSYKWWHRIFFGFLLIYTKLFFKYLVIIKFNFTAAYHIFLNSFNTKTKQVYIYNNKLEDLILNESPLSYKPVYLKYTNFVDIYSALISNPSCLFLCLLLLPLFTYLIYFVCNFLSFRIQRKIR